MPRELRYASLDEALRTLSSSLARDGRVEEADVRAAYGRVLGSDVVAREDVPAHDASHFDGFAIRSIDVAKASGARPVVLKLKAGAGRVGLVPRGALGPGESMKVATGGYLPRGADAVVPVEEATCSEGSVTVDHAVSKRDYVYEAGRDVRRGELVLRNGRTLRGQDLALLASLRVQRVHVRAKPRVAIIPTGSELTADIGRRGDGKVVESHSLLLGSLVEEAGGEPFSTGIVPDDKKALAKALDDGLRRADMAFTLAGSSVGEPDLVESALAGFGTSTEVLVHGVKVHRGRVMGFAVVKGKPVVIVPGPIQGALNAFVLFGYPLIRRHLGLGLEAPPSIPATVGEGWEASGKFKDFDHVVYVELRQAPGGADAGVVAMPSTGETESMSFLVAKDGYILVPGARRRLSKGDPVRVHLVPGFSKLG